MTWNPVTGCTKVSAGCKHCYAEAMAKRLKAMGSPRYKNGFQVTLHHDLLDVPYNWKKPRVVFVNSMSDLFHPQVNDEFIFRVFETMNECGRHTFQVLTKRPERVLDLAHQLKWTENILMGTSVENARVSGRIDVLRRIPAQTRFLSLEPLLGPLENLDLADIHWVIVGGESGPNAREIKHEWVRSIQAQCKNKRVPFFFKQWGGVQRLQSGRELDGATYDEMPVSPRQRLALVGD
jgi:protein gp37